MDGSAICSRLAMYARPRDSEWATLLLTLPVCRMVAPSIAPGATERNGLDKVSSGVPTHVAEENIRAVARIQREAEQRRTFAQRVSDHVSSFASRESTVVWHFVWFAIWIAANVRLLPLRPFDPFPFSLLTTMVSLEAIFLTLFVLASQNRLTQEADRRAHLDLQVNLLAEQEMTVVLQMLKEICEHLELHDTIQSRKFIELVQRTDVGQLAEHVERTLGPDDTTAHDPPQS